MKVLAVIPTLAQDIGRLNRAIESLGLHSKRHSFEILVINNSQLGSIDGLAPVHHIVSPGINLGYVGALELARRSHRSDFIWSVQDDMRIENDVLGLLLDSMERLPLLSVCSPVMLRGAVVPARSRAGLFTNMEKTRWENYPLEDIAPSEMPIDVEYSFVSGSGALFRTSALDDIGGFNLDLYPLMHVDVDICTRLIAKGWQVRLEPKAHITHDIQGSTPNILSKTLEPRNRQLVENALAGKSRSEGHKFDSIDDDIVLAVARRASFLILEVSREANSQLQDIRSSMSWRITAPLRAIGRFLKR
jgi:GT2 family glycosyltransferase